MKHTDYPEEDARTVPFQPEKKGKSPRETAPAEHRELDIPTEHAADGGGRNLGIGIACLFFAAIGLWLGLYYAGAAVARTIVASLGAFGILVILSRLSVFRQRNGMFLAIGVVALFGAAIPFIEGAFRKLDQIARISLGGQPEAGQISAPTLLPPPTRDTAPPAPVASDLPGAEAPTLPEDGADSKRPVVDDGPPRELILPPPPAGSGKLVELLEDIKIPLDGRMTILRAGTVAPFKKFEDDQVTFLVNGSEAVIKSSLVRFTGASKETPADITALADKEVRRRYPKVAEADSRENLIFVTRTKEIAQDKEMRDVFFKDPMWPLTLAEQIAEQEGWIRADLPIDDLTDPAGPAVPANELPAESVVPAAPPADPAGPAVDPANEDLPRQKNPPPPTR